MSGDGYYPYHNAGGYPPTQPYGYGDGSAPNAQWNQGEQQYPNTSAYTGGQAYPPEYIQQQQQYYYANSAALAGALQPPPRPQTAAGYPQSSSAAAAAGYSHSAAGYPPPQTHAMISLDTADPQDVAIIGQKTRSLSNAPRKCTECGTRDTPLWRRHRQTDKPVCNACGLWFGTYGNSKPSPRSQGHGSHSHVGTSSSGSGPVCAHCGTTVASAWRRSKDGEQVCNACGVYERENGVRRPVEYRRDVIKTRSKHSG